MSSHSDNNQSWFIDYTERDWDIVDYQFYELPTVSGVKFRGPKLELNQAGDYFTTIGAAQTLGIYVQKPYPQILSETLGLPALNMALGAAGPGFYAARDELIALVNRGRFLILQIMSARSEPNSCMEETGFIELLRDRKTGDVLGSGQAWSRILAEGETQTRRCVAESQQRWLEHYEELLSKITVPVVLLWFSSKPQDEPINYQAANGAELLSTFPQLVSSDHVRILAGRCAEFAESYSARNAGHPLVSRFTGLPTTADYGLLHEGMKGHIDTHNHYYPSPEMHEDVAAVLLQKIHALRAQYPHVLDQPRS